MTMEAARVMTMLKSGEGLSARLLQGARGLEAIRPVWEELVKDVDSQGFHHQYSWCANYMRHLAPDPGSIFFAWVSRGNQSVAVFPLEYRRAEGFLGLRVLGLPSHDHLCVADALVRRGEDHAAIMDSIIRQLRRSGAPEWDELLFPQVPYGSSVDLGLRGASRKPFMVIREVARDSDHIPNEGGYEATVKRLSGNFRRDLRRKLKHAEKQGVLSYRSVESPEELEEAFVAFLEIEGSGWKGREGTRSAINSNPGLEAFYRGLLRARTPDSHCVINLLYLDDTCIAGEFCLYCNGVLSLLKIGYLESQARISPGGLLFDRVLRDWCERPGVRAISLVGDAAWQKSWHPGEEPVLRYRVYNRTLRGFPAWAWRLIRPRLVWTMNRARKTYDRLSGTMQRVKTAE